MTQPTQAQLLAQPFEAQQLKRVPNKDVTYVPIAEVIDRLNAVLGPSGWSYTSQVMRDPVTPDWIIAQVDLTCEVDGRVATKAGAGGIRVKLFSNTENPVDVGDDYKGAQSDALKKAAQAFGVGLDIARPDTAGKVMPVHLGPVYLAIEELSDDQQDELRKFMRTHGYPKLRLCNSGQANMLLDHITRLVDQPETPEPDTGREAPAEPTAQAEAAPDEAEATERSSTSRRS